MDSTTIAVCSQEEGYKPVISSDSNEISGIVDSCVYRNDGQLKSINKRVEEE